MTDMLMYYLSESCKGDRVAAFEAAKIMTFEKYSDLIIQKQYLRSAELGYVPAQRELGILGLCKKLVEPESIEGDIRYNKDLIEGINWIKLAAKNKDGAAIFILGKCYQLGLGVRINEEKANALIGVASTVLTIDNMIILNLAISMIADTFNASVNSGYTQGIRLETREFLDLVS